MHSRETAMYIIWLYDLESSIFMWPTPELFIYACAIWDTNAAPLISSTKENNAMTSLWYTNAYAHVSVYVSFLLTETRYVKGTYGITEPFSDCQYQSR